MNIDELKRLEGKLDVEPEDGDQAPPLLTHRECSALIAEVWNAWGRIQSLHMVIRGLEGKLELVGTAADVHHATMKQIVDTDGDKPECLLKIDQEDWPRFRKELEAKDPKRVNRFLTMGAAHSNYTTEQIEDLTDQHNDVDAALILEGYKAAGGKG